MKERSMSVPVADMPEDVEGAIDYMFAQIDCALARMSQDQIEIENLRKQTRSLQQETESILASLNGVVKK